MKITTLKEYRNTMNINNSQHCFKSAVAFFFLFHDNCVWKYVVEWFDSSQSRMYKDIEELKKELKERFIK